MTQADALAAFHDGTAHMALVRDTSATDDSHAIPLYREAAVVVAPKESLVTDIAAPALEDLADETVLPVDLVGGTREDAGALVAANAGVATMPQSVARAQSRKDVVARTLSGALDTGISLVWQIDGPHPLVDEFIGIVRGRTANSSRYASCPHVWRDATFSREVPRLLTKPYRFICFRRCAAGKPHRAR